MISLDDIWEQWLGKEGNLYLLVRRGNEFSDLLHTPKFAILGAFWIGNSPKPLLKLIQVFLIESYANAHLMRAQL